MIEGESQCGQSGFGMTDSTPTVMTAPLCWTLVNFNLGRLRRSVDIGE